MPIEKQMWARCSSGHIWKAFDLPMPIDEVAARMKALRCPECGSRELFLPSEAEIRLALNEQHRKEQMESMERAAPASEQEPLPYEWAIVEVFGHRRHAGRCREEERFGEKMLRIDIPKDGDPENMGWETVYYGGSSIFSYTLTDEANALRINKPYVSPYRISLPAPDVEEDDDDIPA
jgi:hypothetical protein